MTYPTSDKWVNSPLRNRIKLELNAPINEVWAIVGEPAKILIYSSDINKVETITDGSGKQTEYTCFYKPCEEIDEETLTKVADVLKIPVAAIKNLTDEGAINIFANTFHDSSVYGSHNQPNNNHCTFNPIEKIVELHERIVELEREKNK